MKIRRLGVNIWARQKKMCAYVWHSVYSVAVFVGSSIRVYWDAKISPLELQDIWGVQDLFLWTERRFY